MRNVLTLIALTMAFLTSAQDEMDLWSDEIPFRIENDEVKEYINPERTETIIVHQIVKPTLRAYVDTDKTEPTAAVVICPGGGYTINAIGHEGYDVAEWFNSIGVAAFVLKYRVPDDRVMTHKAMVPLADAQQAMRLVRQNAEEWNVDPERVGIMGFSAGGHLASTVSTHYEIDAADTGDPTNLRPDFSVLVYPVIAMDGTGHRGSKKRLIGEGARQDTVALFNNHQWVDEQTPPTFLVHSSDDGGVPVSNSIKYYMACVEAGVPASLHAFSKGGHGYGMGNERGPESPWVPLLSDWLEMMDLK
ncbi:MAG: alpha/beta hydrolase [Bacteroidota bacterium]